MSRYLRLIVIVLLGMVVVAACGVNDEDADWEPTQYESVNDLEGVSMTEQEGSASSTGIELLLENTTENYYDYGEPFELEKQMDGEWYAVPIPDEENYGFTDIGYELRAGETAEESVDWEWLYGSLDSGEYRIVKDFIQVREPGDFDTYHLAATFTVE